MSAATVYTELKSKLKSVVPDFELRYKSELAEKILRLKRERNAVIPPESGGSVPLGPETDHALDHPVGRQ